MLFIVDFPIPDFFDSSINVNPFEVHLMELSKKSGIGKSTINNIENGKVSPTLFQLEMIAIALGVNITDLFESEYK